MTDDYRVDLTTIPWKPVAHTLRLAGESLLEAVLAGNGLPAVGQLLPAELFVQLGWLSQAQLDDQPGRRRRFLLWLAGWLRQRWWVQRFLQFYRQLYRKLTHQDGAARELAAAYERLVGRAIAGNLSSSDWQRESHSLFQQSLFGRNGARIPDLFWPLVTALAWDEPALQYKVALTVRAHLQSNYLFTGGEIPTPHLHPTAFWALVAMAPVGSLRHVHAGVRGTLAEALARLQAIAREQVLARPGWAGFWDQWLLWQVVCQGGLPGDPSLRDALAALPLLRETMPHLDPRETPVLADPDWESEKPTWLLAQWEKWHQ